MIRYIVFIVALFLFHLTFSQNERNIARTGNKNYNNGLFSESEVNYRKSLSKDQAFEEVQFNLADALYKQERYDESIDVLTNLTSSTKNSILKSDGYYNLGNNFYQQQKFEEAAEAYKSCLKINPSDEQARYNLTKTLDLLDQQQQQSKNNQEDDNKEDDNKEDQNSGETDSPENEEDDKNKNSNNQNEDSNKETNEDEQNQNQEDNMSGESLSKQEMERILDALQREEEKIQKEMNEKKIIGGHKNIEKDW